MGFEFVEETVKKRKLIGSLSGAWCAGVAFGRSRREPTDAERQVWADQHLLKEFEAGVRHRRSLDPVLAQASLPL
jgi:hypothetical protein